MEFTLRNLHDFGYLGVKYGGEIPLWVFVCGLLLGAVIAYLLGSLNFAIIISKYKFHDDIRNYGSGNGGMTNMMRTYGKGAAGMTFFGDAAKAFLSVMVGTLILGEPGAYIAGFFCILGHTFPLYYKFKGGKGVITTAVMVLCLEPLVFLPLILLFFGIVACTKYISLGSIMSVLVYPLFLNRMYPMLHSGRRPDAIVTIVSMLTAVLVIWLHRGNITRLLNHTENKFSFKKKDKKKLDGTPVPDDDDAGAGGKNDKPADETSADADTGEEDKDSGEDDADNADDADKDAEENSVSDKNNGNNVNNNKKQTSGKKNSKKKK